MKWLPLILALIPSAAHAEYKLNPYTNQRDYYESPAAVASALATSTTSIDSRIDALEAAGVGGSTIAVNASQFSGNGAISNPLNLVTTSVTLQGNSFSISGIAASTGTIYGTLATLPTTYVNVTGDEMSGGIIVPQISLRGTPYDTVIVPGAQSSHIQYTLPLSTDMVGGRFLQTDENGNLSWQEPPVAGAQSFHFSLENTDLAGYYAMYSSYPFVTASTVTFTVSTADISLGTWTTLSGYPQGSTIPGGMWDVHIHAVKTAGTKNARLYGKFYKRSSGGTLTYLGQTENSAILSGASGSINIHFISDEIFLSTGDRIIVNGRAISEGNGTAPQIAIYLGGVYYSSLELPSASVDTTNFVPYTGASGNVSLGTNELYASKIGINGVTSPFYALQIDGALQSSGQAIIKGSATVSGNLAASSYYGNGATLLNVISTGTAFSGDVTGTYSATVVGNDSHAHSGSTVDFSTITARIAAEEAKTATAAYTNASYANPAWITSLATSKIDLSTVTSHILTMIPSSATGTYPLSISGNASTVTNGVYTTGTYANPSWITSLSTSKIDLSTVTSYADTKVAKSGDTMTGQLTLSGSTLTVTGSAFSVGASTLAVTSGKVGIGTASPLQSLDVVGKAMFGTKPASTANHTSAAVAQLFSVSGTSPTLYLGGGEDSVDSEYIRLGRSDSSIRYHSLVGANAMLQTSNYVALRVHNGIGNITQTEAMRWTNTGSVGISSAAPVYTLGVTGTIGSSGGLYAPTIDTTGNGTFGAVCLSGTCQSVWPPYSAWSVSGGNVLSTTFTAVGIAATPTYEIGNTVFEIGGGEDIKLKLSPLNSFNAAYIKFREPTTYIASGGNSIAIVAGTGTVAGAGGISVSYYSGGFTYATLQHNSFKGLLTIGATTYMGSSQPSIYAERSIIADSSITAGGGGFYGSGANLRDVVTSTATGLYPHTHNYLTAPATSYWVKSTDYLVNPASFTIVSPSHTHSYLTSPATFYVVPTSAYLTNPATFYITTATDLSGKVSKTGDTMSGQLTTASTLTVQGSAFSVGGSTLVASSGMVGIGKTPDSGKSALLDVNGNISIGSGGSYRINGAEAVRANGNDLRIGQDLSGSVAVDTGRFTVGTSTFVVSGGKVGIGTTAPIYKLDVNGDAAFVSSATINASASPLLAIRTSGSNTANGAVRFMDGANNTDAFIGTYFNIADEGALEFGTAGATNTDMIIRSNGNVGIGTTAPATKLHMSSGTLLLDGTAASVTLRIDGGRMTFQDSSSNNSVLLGDTNGSGGFITIFDDSGGVRSRISGYDNSYIQGGNLGIGTTAPATKLHMSSGVFRNDGTGAGIYTTGTSSSTSVYVSSTVCLGSDCRSSWPTGGGTIISSVAVDASPIGTIIPYSSTVPPTSYLYCDGSAVSRTTYADLFAITGTAYGAGDGSTTFNLPDMRGMFMRGAYGNLSSRDPDSNRVVGSTQTDTFQGHYHRLGTEANHRYSNYAVEFDAGAGAGTDATHSALEPITDGTNGTPRTSVETRPENLSVAFMIKYTLGQAVQTSTFTQVNSTNTWMGTNTFASGIVFNSTPSYKSGILPFTVTVLTSSGTGVYYSTSSTGVSPRMLRVMICGGGGGGGGGGSAGANGTAGQQSYFGSSVTANGGNGGQTNTANGADGGTATITAPVVGLTVTGSNGQAPASILTGSYGGGGHGGASPFGGAGASNAGTNPAAAATNASANSCSGGGGGASYSVNFAGSGGGAGGYADAYIYYPLPSYSYRVGYNGLAGGSGNNKGSNGGTGVIIIHEYY